MRRIYSEENPDIVHINGLTQIQPGIAAWISGTRVVWHLISDFYPQWALYVFMPLVNFISDGKIVICEANRDYYFPDGRWDNDDVYTVPGTIRTDVYNQEYITEKEANNIFKRYEINPDDLILTTISGINRNKGQHRVVEAIGELNIDVTYLIVGPIDNQNYINEMKVRAREYGIQDSIIFTGTITDDKDSILAASDVFVLISSGEGTPLSIMEAMAMELPVIASNVGGIPDMLHQGEAGIVVQKDSIAEVKDAINRYRDGALREKHGSQGQKIVKNEFDVSVIADEHVEIYASI
jgi:glycosyltransferase involved in cell wall biosynthesis